jgi:cytochrome c oxidase subunit 4
MMRIVGPIAAVWLVLLVLFGLELGGSFAHVGHVYGGFLIVPGGLMVLLIGIFFMHVGRAGRLSSFVALAGLFWLLVLLGLGSLDPMTRTNFTVTYTEYP